VSPRRCEWVIGPDGTRSLVMFAGPGPRRPACAICGSPSSLLCDWVDPEGPGATCDAALCAGCAVTTAAFGVGRVDWCPSHQRDGHG